MSARKRTPIAAAVMSWTLLYGAWAAAQWTVDPETESELAQATPSSELVTPETLSELVEGNTAFALDLYQSLRGEPGNLFYSPYSISVALGMTYAGARTETERQMADVLHFDLGQEGLHPNFQALARQLAERAESARPDEEGDRFELNIANALFTHTDYAFLAEFMNQVMDLYDAVAEAVDFRDEEGSRAHINEWVSEQTEGKIPELIPPGILTPDTRLVLVNAIYFSASWAQAFDEDATQDAPFHLVGGESISVPTMSRTASTGHAEHDGVTVVEVPYLGGEMSFVVMMPELDALEDFEASLTPARLSELLAGIRYDEVRLFVPKFETRSSFQLNDPLIQLGMPLAFSDAADFSGMTGDRDLKISAVIHQAVIEIDESGTEAAAATAVVMARITSAGPPSEPFEIRVDRPFLYLIRDAQTGTIVFMGRLVDPR
jgi:serpin B